MMKKITLILIISMLLMGCGEVVNEADEDMTESEQIFTAETLKAFNGENDNKAYIAVDGKVYDVTDVVAWQSPHGNGYKPGFDYSEEINQSPHGKSKLNGLKVVGKYEE